MPRRTTQSGFTLIELIAVIVILGSLSAIAVPTYVDLRESARQAAFVSTMGSIVDGIKQAKANWLARGTGGAQLNVPGYAGGTLDYNSVGLPVGTNLASIAATAADPTDNQCRDLFLALVPTLRITVSGETYPAPGMTHFVYASSSTLCAIHPLDSQGFLQETSTGLLRHGWIQVGSSLLHAPLGTVAVYFPNSSNSGYDFYFMRVE